MKSIDNDTKRLLIRAMLSLTLLGIFCVLLILMFYVELPTTMETMAATLLGALVGNLTSTLSFWFDSTESADHHVKSLTDVVNNNNGDKNIDND
tara:strand:+ start:272 stop:553 length:282 start_codon:yes stop_codon:yes gene_type:complete